MSTMYECCVNDKTYLEVLSNFTDKTLEGKFADEEFGGFLVLADFTESDGSGTEAMGLLDTTSGGLRGMSVQMKIREDKSNARQSCAPATWQRAACGAPCHQ